MDCFGSVPSPALQLPELDGTTDGTKFDEDMLLGNISPSLAVNLDVFSDDQDAHGQDQCPLSLEDIENFVTRSEDFIHSPFCI